MSGKNSEYRAVVVLEQTSVGWIEIDRLYTIHTIGPSVIEFLIKKKSRTVFLRIRM